MYHCFSESVQLRSNGLSNGKIRSSTREFLIIAKKYTYYWCSIRMVHYRLITVVRPTDASISSRKMNYKWFVFQTLFDRMSLPSGGARNSPPPNPTPTFHPHNMPLAPVFVWSHHSHLTRSPLPRLKHDPSVASAHVLFPHFTYFMPIIYFDHY